MDTSLGCETAVVDISSAVPHNESTIVPSSSKTEPSVEVFEKTASRCNAVFAVCMYLDHLRSL